MTRPPKKEDQKRLATRLVEDWLPHTSLDEDERPDFRVLHGRRPEIGCLVHDAGPHPCKISPLPCWPPGALIAVPRTPG
jgi:hypothetical protein